MNNNHQTPRAILLAIDVLNNELYTITKKTMQQVIHLIISTDSNVIILYDEECPLCSSYMHYYALRNSTKTLELVNAREPSALKSELTDMGMNLDKGMAVKIDDNIYFGSDALHILSIISTRHGWFNRLSLLVFGSKPIAKTLYPFCRAGRWIALKIKGVSAINNLNL